MANMKPKPPEMFKDVFQQYLEAVGAANRIKELRAMQAWDEAVGKYIAKQTKSLTMKDGVMTVRFNAAILRNELSLRRTSLMQRINEIVGGDIVKNLIIK